MVFMLSQLRFQGVIFFCQENKARGKVFIALLVRQVGFVNRARIGFKAQWSLTSFGKEELSWMP
jgi:hypothetical protein